MKSEELSWQQCLAMIRGEVKQHVYDTWFRDITIDSYDEEKNTVVLEVPSTYVYEYIEELHVPLMNRVLCTAFGNGVKLGYRLRREPAAASAVEYPEAPVIPSFRIADARERLEKGLRHYLGDRAQWLPCYDRVADWLTDNKGRGLLCVGTPGLGKTLVCTKILPVILGSCGRPIPSVNAAELHARLDELKKERILIIDDLGKEDIKHYGQTDRSFYKLCDAAEQRGILLIITTNLSTTPVADPRYPDSIQNRYGLEVLDRLKAITSVALLKGTSLRK